MVRDLAKHVPAGLPLLSSEGLYGIQDGGASSVVCGHDALMRIIDHMKARGVPVERFLFAATNKVFGFGGDANRHADWSVRLPVYIEGQAGYIETFIVEGNTPLLIGRPILQALNIKIDYSSNQVSIQDGDWEALTMTPRTPVLPSPTTRTWTTIHLHPRLPDDDKTKPTRDCLPGG